MNAYEALAASYDALTYDIPYEEIFQFMKEIFRQRGKNPKSILDLACGTGSLSLLLAQAGYEVTGVDLSEEMLTIASEKVMDMEKRPFFACQAMEKLRLPYLVEAVVCCLDSLNYLVKPADCCETIRRVYETLSPGGIFIFDINSVRKLKSMDGQIFLDETEDTYCVWRTEFVEEENICYYGMDLFQRNGTQWHRSFEEHREYAYSVEQLKTYLLQAGFGSVQVYGDRRLESPLPEEQRIFFVASKE